MTMSYKHDNDIDDNNNNDNYDKDDLEDKKMIGECLRPIQAI